MMFDLERLSPRVRRLVFRTATLLGVALMIGAGLQAGTSLKLVRSGERADGQVVDLGAAHPFVRFTRADGQVVTFRADGLLDRRVGRAVPVLSDPFRPSAAPTVATPAALWLSPALMMIAGGLLFGFGFRPKPKKA